MCRWLFLFVWSSLCLSGCTVALTKSQRASLRSLSIDPKIETPSENEYRGFYIFEPKSDDLRPLLKARGVDPYAILHDAFAEQLRRVPGLPPLQDEKADAVFHLKVLVYGIERAPQVTGGPRDSWLLKPLLSVNASLTLPDGKVIWTGRAHVTNMSSKLDSFYLIDAIENPELARKGLEQATALVAAELVETLAEER